MYNCYSFLQRMKLQISGPVEILTDPLKDSERGVVKVLLELPKSHSNGHNEGTIYRKGMSMYFG